MRFHGLLLLAGLLVSVGASAHGGHDHSAATGDTGTLPTVPPPSIQSAPDTQALIDALGLPADTAARLRQMLATYQQQQTDLRTRYHAANGEERERLGWLLHQAARHHRRQVAALLTPEQEQAFFALLNADRASSQQ